MENIEMKLADMVPEEWFVNRDKSTFWLRIYTTLPVAQNKINEYFENSLRSYVVDSQPIKLVILGLKEGLELLEIKNSIVHSDPESGSMVIPVKVDKISFPKSSYIFFFAPYKLNGVDGNVNKTKSNLDQLEAVLSARLGNNILYSLVYEGEHPLTDECKSQIYGQAFQVLNPCEGPFFTEKHWVKALEITGAIEMLEDVDKQNRIRLALQYYQKGKNIFRCEEKFFFYWTALMIVTADSTTMQINNKLQIIYSCDKGFVENELAWIWAVTCRNNFFKRGVKLNFHANRERYFQMLFLDLLECELGFDAEKHLLSYITQFPDWNSN
jgi:hypothetical protein